MRSEFKLRLLLVPPLVVAAIAWAQVCPVPIPSAPPSPNRLIIILPPDGGTTALSDGGTTTGCAGYAGGTSSVPANVYAIAGAAKCKTASDIAAQMYANDNGWNDGGTP